MQPLGVIDYRCQAGSVDMPIRMTYAQIANDLEARIEAGEYQPGQQLPSYEELKKLYSVSYATVARAVALLRDRELVDGSPGRGTFVRETG